MNSVFELAQNAQNAAVFEMAGMRYLLVAIGPAGDYQTESHPNIPVSLKETDVPLTQAFTQANKSFSAEKKFVYGLKGIAELFGCSKSTAYNIKRSGRIDDAVSQVGNTIVVDAVKALELAKK